MGSVEDGGGVEGGCVQSKGRKDGEVTCTTKSIKSSSLHTLLTMMSLVGVVCDSCSVLLEE